MLGLYSLHEVGEDGDEECQTHQRLISLKLRLLYASTRCTSTPAVAAYRSSTEAITVRVT